MVLVIVDAVGTLCRLSLWGVSGRNDSRHGRSGARREMHGAQSCTLSRSLGGLAMTSLVLFFFFLILIEV